jgi:GNAT superfamily N-acetyltransferase
LTTGLSSPDLAITRAEARHAAGLGALFASNGYGCFCRFWHFGGTSREWLERCFTHPEENRDAMEVALRAESAEMSGVVAETASGEILGWLKLAPATVLAKLYEQRLYKGLQCFNGDRHGIYSIGCMLVREDQRRRGIGRALIAGAVAEAARSGARAIEAFPRSDTDASDAALMLGPLQPFLDAGFQVVRDFFPYPVLRLELQPSQATE